MSRSSRRSASTGSPPPPEFFVDRSLGRYEVPGALRDAGITVHTMADIHGEDWGQRLDDETWLAEVAGTGWVALFKDYATVRRPAQIAAVKAGGLRCFCLSHGNLRGADQARWFLANLARTQRAALKSGPYLDGVYEDRLELRWPLDAATKRQPTP